MKRRVFAILPLALLLGCGQRSTVVEAFPPAAVADPWILQDVVWSGTFEEATAGLGDDAEAWRPHGPQRVWLAIYCHEYRLEECCKVRAFAFANARQAHGAYSEFKPDDAKPFEIGDAGCWTDDGVLFCWGRLVFELFGDDPSWSSQVRSSLIASFIGKRMPPGVPDDPR